MQLKHLPGYSTFNEALIQCLEEKLKPIWANLIIEIDVNNNLLLVDAISDGEYYQHELWLKIAEIACSSSINVTNMSANIGSCTFPFSEHVILMVEDNISNIGEKSDIGES